jgi:hypothetical protein
VIAVIALEELPDRGMRREACRPQRLRDIIGQDSAYRPFESVTDNIKESTKENEGKNG